MFYTVIILRLIFIFCYVWKFFGYVYYFDNYIEVKNMLIKSLM